MQRREKDAKKKRNLKLFNIFTKFYLYKYIHSAIILYFISWAKLGSAQPGSRQIRLDLK